MKKEWKVEDGHYPGFKKLTGPAFVVSVVMSASDLTLEDYIARDADLHLMAAAPELLECLKEAIDIIGHPDDNLTKLFASVVAKAEGRAS